MALCRGGMLLWIAKLGGGICGRVWVEELAVP